MDSSNTSDRERLQKTRKGLRQRPATVPGATAVGSNNSGNLHPSASVPGATPKSGPSVPSKGLRRKKQPGVAGSASTETGRIIPQSKMTKGTDSIQQDTSAVVPGATEVGPGSDCRPAVLRGLRKNAKGQARKSEQKEEERATDPPIVVPHPNQRGLKRTQEELEAKAAARRGNTKDGTPSHGASNVSSVSYERVVLRGLGKNGKANRQTKVASNHNEENEEEVVVPPLQAFEGTSGRDLEEASKEMIENPAQEVFQDTGANEAQPSLQGRALSDSGLAVAMPVLQDSTKNVLAQAQQVDPAQLEQSANQKQKRRQCKKIGCGIIVFFLTVAAIALGVGFGTRKKESTVDDLNERNATPTASPTTSSPSAAPSSAPSTGLDALLQDLPASTVQNIYTTGTHQEQAYAWLFNHRNITNLPVWRMKQMFALATFYHAFEGDNWFGGATHDWLDEGKDECNWFSGQYGSFCSEVEGYEEADKYRGVPVCDNNKEFQFLNLECLQLENLSPYIPPEIALLTSLKIIQLRYNDMPGYLPSELVMLTPLRRLSLYGNLLTGPIPTELGQMTSLVQLYLYDNQLTGTIPSELVKLTLFNDLLLQTNKLSGPIPTEIGQMTALTKLNLRTNRLTGPIPSELGQLNAVGGMWLHKNQLMGPIPTELGQMTALRILSLATNGLIGPIPTELSSMKKLQRLQLWETRVSGSIPIELGLMTRLAILNLYDNSLTGSLPSELGRLRKMVELQVAMNALTGPIPNEIGMMTRISKLHLHTNILSGSIPSELGLMTSLESLKLENNALRGTIPHELAFLAENGPLARLTLSNNSLSGTVPERLCSLGIYDSNLELGLSFVCSDQLCGCCWCPCPGSNSSAFCPTQPANYDTEWPGTFPNSANAIAINIRTDEFPEETTLKWSLLSGLGVWELLDSHSEHDASSVNSYTKEVQSDALYMLGIQDSAADGTCCGSGYGWFTITNSTPSQDYGEGTVIWKAIGDSFRRSLDVLLWIDAEGHAQLAEYLPGQGYALIEDEAAPVAEPVIVVPEKSNSEMVDESEP